jgi:hypothetical protein
LILLSITILPQNSNLQDHERATRASSHRDLGGPSPISQHGNRDPSRRPGATSNKQEMVNTPREIEMAEAASNKRHSTGDTNDNPKKKSTIQ